MSRISRGKLHGSAHNTSEIQPSNITCGGSSTNQTKINRGDVTCTGGTTTLNDLIVNGNFTVPSITIGGTETLPNLTLNGNLITSEEGYTIASTATSNSDGVIQLRRSQRATYLLDVYNQMASTTGNDFREVTRFKVENSNMGTGNHFKYSLLMFGQKTQNNMFIEAKAEDNNDDIIEGNLLLQPNGGNVGIGPTSWTTSPPLYRLVVMGPDPNTVSGTSWNSWSFIRYHGGSDSAHNNFSLQLKEDIGILCEGGNIFASRTAGQSTAGNTVGGHIVAYWGTLNSSDERIKYDIEDINDSSALEKLRELKPKTYKYRDYKDLQSDRSGTVYGFIAQEVNSVFPQAVRILGKEHVPNIQEVGVYSSANKTITFTNFDTSGIPTSGVIKVITAKKEFEYLDINYISIIDSHTIEVETDISEHCGAFDEENEEFIAGNNIYVEGCEVPDFHLLRKESIFTLATAALQEVDRQLQAEKAKTASLETTVADLVARITALENA